MPSYKLTYFDVRGRGEVIRLLFTYAKQSFEDVRLSFGEDWAEFKPKTPFGQMPVLEVDGRMFAQTNAIANYLGREFGLYGKNSLDDFAIDQAIGIIGDFLNATVKVMWEKDEAKKAELSKIYKDEEVPKYMGFLEKLLKLSGTGYFVGDKVTLADITVYDFVWSLESRMEGTVEKYPAVKAHYEMIGAIPQIKAYVDARKITPF